MRKLLIALPIFLMSCEKVLELRGQALNGHGGMGGYHSTLNNLFQPQPGSLIITDTQTVNTWIRNWGQEATLFYDNSTSNVKIYFTGGADSLGTTAYNNKVGYVTSSDMLSFSTPTKLIGQGLGGAPTNRRVTSSWVGKEAGRYFCLGLNGYGIGWPGEDRNIYGYTSTDGITWADAGLKINKSTAWTSPVAGFGNTAVVVDEFNNPQVIGGKYVALIEAYQSSHWLTYRAEADSLMGTWTLTDSLPTLQVNGMGGYSGGCVIYKNGKYYNFYHYAASAGNYPSNLAYATSTNGVTWSIKEAPFFDLTTKPYGVNTDQIADPFITEINGKVYMIAEYAQNSPTYKSQLTLWVFNGTFDLMTKLLPY